MTTAASKTKVYYLVELVFESLYTEPIRGPNAASCISLVKDCEESSKSTKTFYSSLLSLKRENLASK